MEGGSGKYYLASCGTRLGTRPSEARTHRCQRTPFWHQIRWGKQLSSRNPARVGAAAASGEAATRKTANREVDHHRAHPSHKPRRRHPSICAAKASGRQNAAASLIAAAANDKTTEDQTNYPRIKRSKTWYATCREEITKKSGLRIYRSTWTSCNCRGVSTGLRW